jgi:deoxyguanosine kinase
VAQSSMPRPLRPYIGFEGPIGAGKTTLATLLTEKTGARLVLEDVNGNEFLADFYVDRKRWALPMQLWFLTARHAQLAQIEPLRTEMLVGDYTFAKDRIFARALLDQRELGLYDRVAGGLKELRHPDLMVYLDADDEVLLGRIAKRKRSYERAITSSYLDEVRAAYENYLQSGSEPNVLRVDTSTLDLRSEGLHRLFDEILERCC